jgi:hypothetical protein
MGVCIPVPTPYPIHNKEFKGCLIVSINKTKKTALDVPVPDFETLLGTGVMCKLISLNSIRIFYATKLG